MSLTSDYRYDLRVEGADERVLDQFKTAFENTHFAYCMDQDPDDPALFTTEAVSGSGGMFEEDIHEYLHDLALQFPQLTLTFTAEDLFDSGHGYELILKGDMFQRSFLDSVWTKPFAPVPFADREEAFRSDLRRQEDIMKLTDKIQNETDYDLLYAQKLALLEHLTSGTPVPKEALFGLINFLDHMGDLGEVLGRFRYDDIEPPFPTLPEYEKKICVFTPEPAPKAYVLCEEFEGTDGIRTFTILGVSHDEQALRQMMQAKIDLDEYGYIAKNGVDEDLRDNHFVTNYDNGFVEYYIVEEEVLSHDKALALTEQIANAAPENPAVPAYSEAELENETSEMITREMIEKEKAERLAFIKGFGNECAYTDSWAEKIEAMERQLLKNTEQQRGPTLDSIIGSARDRAQSAAEQGAHPSPHRTTPEK